MCMLVVCGGIMAGGLFFLKKRYRQGIELPTPTGPFRVGRACYDWVDHSRAEVFVRQGEARRELLVWIWYPAEVTEKKRPADYLPEKWGEAWNRLHGFPFDLLHQKADSIRIHALEGVAVSTVHPRYPVLIFEPGLSRLPTDYTTLAEDLASHGYIVAGIVPTYKASVAVFPDGRTIYSVGQAQLGGPATRQKILSQLMTIWTEDIRFVINQMERLNADPGSLFVGRMDLTRIGLSGHSFGGAAAIEASRVDVRSKAAANLDGTLYTNRTSPIEKPLLCVYHQKIDQHTRQAMRAIIPQTADGEHHLMTIKGMGHENFSDQALLFSPLRLFGMLGPIQGQRGLQISRDYVRAFFDTYLKGEPSPLMRGPSDRYPEVQFLHL